MCGIFGWIGEPREHNWRVACMLQALAIEDQSRGKHSTGIVIMSGSKCFFQKKALSGTDFVAKGYTEFLFNTKFSAALGHNRYATAGAITDRNAHPFSVKVGDGWNFGIHNGIVGSKKAIAEKYGVNEPDVDSEVVFRAIAALQNKGKSIPEAIASVTKFISANADFAFAYLDAATGDVYAWRSMERPLVVIDARKTLVGGRFFCSTKEIFKAAWSSLRGLTGSGKKVSFFDARPYALYKFSAKRPYEVDAIMELPHKSRWTPEPKSFYSRHTDDDTNLLSGVSSFVPRYNNKYFKRSAPSIDAKEILGEDIDEYEGFVESLSDEDLQSELFMARANGATDPKMAAYSKLIDTEGIRRGLWR